MDALTDKPSSRQMALANVYAPDQRFAAVLKSVDGGFIALDRDWVYTALNDYACRSMDRRREEVLGRCIWHLYPDTVGTFFEAQLRRALVEEQTVQFEYFYASRNRWYENHVYPGSEGVSIFFADITDRKHAEEAQIASAKRLAGDLGLMKTLQEVSTRLVRDCDANPPLLEIIDAAIDITDADGGSIQMLDRDAGLLRMTASRGVEPPLLDFFATVGHGHASSCSRATECGARVVIEDVEVSPVFAGTPALEVLIAAGVRAVQSTPLVSRSGEPLGMLNTYYSTPRVPLQRDLHLLDVLSRQAADWIERTHAQANLRRAKRALEEADQHKNEFLAALAHELRNPLASILAGSRLLRRLEPGARELQKTRDMIEQQVAQLTRLVDDLLDVSRVATGRVVLRRAPLDLRRPLHHAVETVRPRLLTRRHRLQLNIASEPISVDGDAVRLVRVFSNLLANATESTPQAGTICVAARVEDTQAVVRIRDPGIGIAREDLPGIFKACNGMEHRERSGGSPGVGLVLARQLVELHQGSLEAFSDGPERGSEFVVRLPLANAPPVADQGIAPASTARASAGPHRILIVDDNESFATAMTGLLNAMGHDARAIHDGAAALEMVRSMRPLVVILDINLPGRRGYDIAREIRGDPLIAHTLLIAVTGFAQERDKLQAQRAGFDYHLAKPVDGKTLERLIETALAGRECRCD